MAHTFTQNYIHLVFSTKQRAKLIEKKMQPRLWAYIAGICHQEKMICRAVGGTDDHVHVLFQLPPTIALAKAVQVLKSNSSRWMSERGRPFSWQEGYAGFAVSASLVPTVERYIQNQERHHRKMSFKDELIALLKKHGIEFDESEILE